MNAKGRLYGRGISDILGLVQKEHVCIQGPVGEPLGELPAVPLGAFRPPSGGHSGGFRGGMPPSGGALGRE
jgi:hypothetical protein